MMSGLSPLKDELLVADEKVVLEVSDLVKWVVDVGSVTWPYGFQMPHPHHPKKKQEEEDVSVAAKGNLPAGGEGRSFCYSPTKGFKEHGNIFRQSDARHESKHLNYKWLHQLKRTQ